MLKKKAHAQEEQRYLKKFVCLSLDDKINTDINSSSSSTGEILEDSEVVATPFPLCSSHTDQPSSPLYSENEFELPTCSCVYVVPKKTLAMVMDSTEEGEGQEAVVEVVW